MTGSLDSSVGIANGYGVDDRGVGVRVPVGSRILSSGGHSTSYTMCTGAVFSGVKRPRREVDHLPPIVPRSRK
jgi:hypothetical protein